MIDPLTILYGSMAIVALLATWRDHDLRWVGAWLVIGCAISNALYYVHIDPVTRTGPYTFIEIMVALAATMAINGRARWLIAILPCNLISIAFNIGLVLNNPPTPGQIYLWELGTNLCFSAECLLAVGAGGGYGRAVGYFRPRLSVRRAAAPVGSAEKDGQP